MSVVIETTLGDITVDLYLEQRPVTCLNFLKLCKMKYYNFNLFHSIRSGFIAQTGDPTAEGSGGQSIFGLLEGPEKRFFSGEKLPKIRHTNTGTISMVCTGDMMVGSQFFFTLAPDLDSLDSMHCVIGEVTEGHDVLRMLNDVICDENHRPYRDVRITHTVVLEDPFNDPPGLRAPSRSPSPSEERLKGGRIAPDEDIDEAQGKSAQEIQEMIEEKEAKARATILEIVGDLPDADVAPPENVLFVCKLNPVTTDEDLEIIFSRFGKIMGCEVIRDKKTGDSLQYAFIEFADKKSCEDAYFKMDNVLIDDRRIHVDFSQSVSRMRWMGKGKGIKYFNNNEKQQEINSSKHSHKKDRDREDDTNGKVEENKHRRHGSKDRSYHDNKDKDSKYDRRDRHDKNKDSDRHSKHRDSDRHRSRRERSRSRNRSRRHSRSRTDKSDRDRSRRNRSKSRSDRNDRHRSRRDRSRSRNKSRHHVDRTDTRKERSTKPEERSNSQSQKDQPVNKSRKSRDRSTNSTYWDKSELETSQDVPSEKGNNTNSYWSQLLFESTIDKSEKSSKKPKTSEARDVSLSKQNHEYNLGDRNEGLSRWEKDETTNSYWAQLPTKSTIDGSGEKSNSKSQIIEAKHVSPVKDRVENESARKSSDRNDSSSRWETIEETKSQDKNSESHENTNRYWSQQPFESTIDQSEKSNSNSKASESKDVSPSRLNQYDQLKDKPTRKSSDKIKTSSRWDKKKSQHEISENCENVNSQQPSESTINEEVKASNNFNTREPQDLSPSKQNRERKNQLDIANHESQERKIYTSKSDDIENLQTNDSNKKALVTCQNSDSKTDSEVHDTIQYSESSKETSNHKEKTHSEPNASMKTSHSKHDSKHKQSDDRKKISTDTKKQKQSNKDMTVDKKSNKEKFDKNRKEKDPRTPTPITDRKNKISKKECSKKKITRVIKKKRKHSTSSSDSSSESSSTSESSSSSDEGRKKKPAKSRKRKVSTSSSSSSTSTTSSSSSSTTDSSTSSSSDSEPNKKKRKKIVTTKGDKIKKTKKKL